MVGELSFLTILEVVVEVAEEGVVVVLGVLISNAMNVVSQDILLVNVVHVAAAGVVAAAVVLEEDVAAVHGTVGVQVMVAGLILESCNL